MTLSMARCIGRADCVNKPNAGRGLCITCYTWHRNRKTLKNFPTMRERVAQLYAHGQVLQSSSGRRQSRNAAANFRWRQVKYAERVLVKKVLVHPNAPHGDIHSYNSYGCRGAMCQAARIYKKRTGNGAIPRDLRGTTQPSARECAEFDITTFLGAYL